MDMDKYIEQAVKVETIVNSVETQILNFLSYYIDIQDLVVYISPTDLCILKELNAVYLTEEVTTENCVLCGVKCKPMLVVSPIVTLAPPTTT